MRIGFAARAAIVVGLPIAVGQITASEVRPAASAVAANTSAVEENVQAANPAGAEKGGEAAALEKKLLGSWSGPACGGTFTFGADGSFKLQHYTPGNNQLTGVWVVRWNALPPTLVLTSKTSDFTTKSPTREEYEYLGKPLELKLVELDSDNFVFRYPKDNGDQRYERPAEK